MSSYAYSIETQIRNLEAMAEQLEGLLTPLYERRKEETKLLSDDDRLELLSWLDGAVEVETLDSYEKHTLTIYLRRGWYDFTDGELLEVWFDDMGSLEDIQSSPGWKGCLEGNLGAVAALGNWLNKQAAPVLA